jgi:hypothetical protein
VKHSDNTPPLPPVPPSILLASYPHLRPPAPNGFNQSPVPATQLSHGLWQPCKTLDKSVPAVLPIRRTVGKGLRKLGALASVGFHGADKIPRSFHNVTKNCLSLGPIFRPTLHSPRHANLTLVDGVARTVRLDK